MAFTPNLTLVRVTGSFITAQGTPATGSVTFTLSTIIVDRTADQVIVNTPVVAQLTNGAFAVDLPATDDPDLYPSTDVYYTVQENVSGSSRTYTITLPQDTVGGVDLADVVPVAVSPVPAYALMRFATLADVDLTLGTGTLTYDAGTGIVSTGGVGGGGGATAVTHVFRTGSHTLIATDAAKLIDVDSASTATVTVPANASIAFAVGTVIGFRQYGVGTVTIAAAGGVTIRSRGGAMSLAGRYAEASLVKRATDEWVLVGDVA